MLQTSAYEALLIRELHRAEFEEICAAFGENYEPLAGEDFDKMAAKWLPLLRGYIHHELQLSLQREAALRAMVEKGM